MESFFYLHQVLTLQKVTIASLYLKPDKLVWYQWLCEHKNKSIVSLFVFTVELVEHYEDIKRNPPSKSKEIQQIILMNVLYCETELLKMFNVLCNWTFFLKIYQLTK